MRTLATLFLAVLLLAAGRVHAQQFEGSIKIDLSWKPSRTTVLYYKAGRSLTQILEPSYAYNLRILKDPANASVVVYSLHNDEPHMEKMALAQAGRVSEVLTAADASMEVEMVEETRVIEGHTCHKFVGTRMGRPITAWVALDLAYIPVREITPPQSPEFISYLQLPGVKGLVLEMETTDEAGRTIRIVNHVELTAVPDRMFVLP
ncbi:MAG: hypothetical protein EAZ89_13175 [Bacteroidetes bacterium]|jgi:hypothetical protein|nr:MAG: hypothetical protein EAZ89_13175 [Bacteroidota bacterium]